MRFPHSLHVHIKDRDSGASVERLAIVLTLFAPEKNNYVVGPMISDSQGKLTFYKADCEFAIQQAQTMFIMDYKGDLQACLPLIEINLHPAEQIRRMLEQYAAAPAFWGKAFSEPQRLFENLRKVDNEDYDHASLRLTEAQLLGDPQVVLFVRRRTN